METLASKKLALITKVSSEENSSLIDYLLGLMDGDVAFDYESLTEAEKVGIEKGLKAVKAGNTISHNTAKKTYEKWL